MSNHRGISGFLFITAVGLFAFSVTLLRGLPAAGPVLNIPDAVFPFSSRAVLYVMGVASLGLSAFLLVGGPRQLVLKLCLVAWFASTLCLYQAGSLYECQPDLLGCWGNVDHRIPVPPRILHVRA